MARPPRARPAAEGTSQPRTGAGRYVEEFRDAAGCSVQAAYTANEARQECFQTGEAKPNAMVWPTLIDAVGAG